MCGQQKLSNGPGNNQHNLQYANYWAPLTRKRHILPHSAPPRHTNDWAPRTRKRHQQEHRPQRPTERSDPMQHAKGRTGDCPGPRSETTTRRNVTQGGGGGLKRGANSPSPPHPPSTFFGSPGQGIVFVLQFQSGNREGVSRHPRMEVFCDTHATPEQHPGNTLACDARAAPPTRSAPVTAASNAGDSAL